MEVKRIRTYFSLGALITVAALAAGCASAPAKQQPQTAQAPNELYDGVPTAVHGTEYPVTSAEEGVNRGDAAWHQGNLDLAVYLYVQAIRFDANNVAALRKIGAIHEERGNHMLARRAYQMALDRGGEHAATMERLGLLMVEDGLNDEAYQMLIKTLTVDPDRWRAHNALGVLADRRGNHVSAQTHYGNALEIKADAGSVYNNRGYSRFLAGDLLGAERDLRQAIALNAGPSAWLNLGRVQAKERQYGVAFKSFLETLDEAHAYNEVGEAAMRNKDHLVAKAYLEKAADASPSYFEQAHKNLTLVNAELAGPTQLP